MILLSLEFVLVMLNEKENKMNMGVVPSQYGGLLTIAQMPRNNPKSFVFDRYDLTPVDHDYSGQFQIKANYVFRTLGMDIGFIMVIGDPKKAEMIYDAFRHDSKYVGGGTGSGFKNRAPEFLDEIDPLASQIGAVNVVAKKGGRLIGYNTDGTGFVRGLEEFFKKISYSRADFSRLNVLILGAGGTADAIAFTLAGRGAKIVILNRTEDKALKLAERINRVYGSIASGGGEDQISKMVPEADVIINASTKGAEGIFKDYSAFANAEEGKLEENLTQSTEVIKSLKTDVIVCDINLRQDESPTLTQSRIAGHFVLDGTSMNLYQAVEALWIIHHDDFVRLSVSKEKLAELVANAS